MELILSSEEGRLLVEVLEERHCQLLREICHTSHRDFKMILKNNERLLESILNKLRAAETVPA
jgi:hypothetical protein